MRQVNKFDSVVLGQGAVLKADEGIKVVLPLSCNNQWVDDTKSILAAKLTFEPQYVMKSLRREQSNDQAQFLPIKNLDPNHKF